MQIILGSESKGRQLVLQRMGYEFAVVPADIDEKLVRRSEAAELVQAVAHAKTTALTTRLSPSGVLITADTVVVWEDQILEKPTSPDEARGWLRGLPKSPAKVVSGVVVTNLATGEQRIGVEEAIIYFDLIPEPIIDELIASGSVYQWAGAFGTEHPLLKPLVVKIVGEEECIIGLPRKLTQQFLREVSPQ